MYFELRAIHMLHSQRLSHNRRSSFNGEPFTVALQTFDGASQLDVAGLQNGIPEVAAVRLTTVGGLLLVLDDVSALPDEMGKPLLFVPAFVRSLGGKAFGGLGHLTGAVVQGEVVEEALGDGVTASHFGGKVHGGLPVMMKDPIPHGALPRLIAVLSEDVTKVF